ncbi:MAG: FHA domain-containing protein [Rhodocyclaceae bacterium]|nr:FHA domain-containing protein [Rhodocyclaceae bacterium]
MIGCLLVQVTRNRHGQPIRTERRIAGDSLRIGRGAECAIHLPDHRVSLRHAVIRDTGDGKYYIEAEGASIGINGELRQGAELTPGTRVLIGPYQLVAEAPADGAELVISTELVHRRPPEEAILTRAPASLAAVGLSKRRPALWLAVLIAVLFLLLPVLQATSPAARQALASLPLTPEQAWSPGPLLPGHQAFATQCNQCHRRPFEAVPDKACESCHRTTAPHSSPDVAAAIRCAECHRDHKGGNGLVLGDKPLCVACHGNAAGRRSGSALVNVHGFDADHPEFRLSFKSRPDQPRPRRISQSDKSGLVEESGLKFSHKAHSGKLRVPSDPQKIRAMKCADCHQPDSGGLRFKPVTMKDHCFDCHKEKFDFDPPLDEYRLPHGPERAVMDVLEHFYLKRALNADAPRGGAAGGASARQALEAARARAQKAASALVDDMGCGFCHEIEPAADPAAASWKVRPVRLTEHWLPAARFAHDKHRTSGCAECHDLGRSEKSADVAIPDIKKCRQCHAGETPGNHKVASPCAACHRFHQAGLVLPGPPALTERLRRWAAAHA